MKRIISASVVLVLAAGIALAEGSKETAKAPAGPVKMKFFQELDAKISATLKSHKEVAAFREMEKLTGMDIEWIHPPVGQGAEQFNLMIASMDLPDMIYWNWGAYPGGPAKAIRDKVILPLNEQAAKGAPELTRIFNANPEAKKQAVLDDGTIFMFPMFRLRQDSPDWFKINGPQFRKDWLAKAGLKPPTTLDELYKVLTYFKNNDMNGNGDTGDEIPFAAQKAGDLRNLAGAFGVSHQFYLKGGKVAYGPVDPAYKDLKELRREGYGE